MPSLRGTVDQCLHSKFLQQEANASQWIAFLKRMPCNLLRMYVRTKNYEYDSINEASVSLQFTKDNVEDIEFRGTELHILLLPIIIIIHTYS